MHRVQQKPGNELAHSKRVPRAGALHLSETPLVLRAPPATERGP